jgi:hypothetical protein
MLADLAQSIADDRHFHPRMSRQVFLQSKLYSISYSVICFCWLLSRANFGV